MRRENRGKFLWKTHKPDAHVNHMLINYALIIDMLINFTAILRITSEIFMDCKVVPQLACNLDNGDYIS